MNLARLALFAGAMMQAAAALSAPPRVLVTLPALFSWTASVAGTNAVIEALLPPEAGPHQYRLRPQDVQHLRAADLLIINGLGVDDWIAKAVEKESRPSGPMPVIRVSSGLESLLLLEEHSADPNPHIWLDPKLAGLCVSNIVAALSRVDPASAPAYAANGTRYQAVLGRLDREIRAGLSGLATTNLVSFHDAFPYFARRYGLRLVGIIEDQPNVDPSPRHLAQVSHIIREFHVPVIFAEPQYSPRLVDRIAADLGVKVAVLDVLETGASTASFYEEAMRRNLRTLQENLH